MQLLKKIPFFLFLLVLFFCLHGSTENYGFIDLGEVLVIGSLISIGVAVLYLVVFFITRNYLFAALISFFISLWYLFFGPIEDYIKSSSWLFFMQRDSIIIPLLLVATFAWIIYLRRNKASHAWWAFYLNLLLIIYCSIDICQVLYKYFTPAKKANSQIAFDYSKAGHKPNVYFLLFDEYPGYQSLQDSFAFRNDSLYNFLRRESFVILPVFSNYDYTMFSMSSMLNMQYVKPGYDPLKLDQQDFQLRTAEIRHGEVISIFKKMGYRINNFSIFDIGDQHGVSDQNAFLPVHSLMLTDKILHNRIIRTSGWMLRSGRFGLSSLKKDYLYQQQVNNLRSEKMLREQVAGKKNGPQFCYAHFMMPHGPYYKDSAGHDISYELLAYESWQSNKQLFLSYLKYTNQKIMSFVSSISENDPGAIIVVMSDHGFRTYKNRLSFYQSFNFNNICAVRFPDKNYLDIKPSWSAVNFFRYLFNAEFGQSIPYLADSTVLLGHDIPKK